MADVFMLVNLVLKIHFQSRNWFLKILRMYRATTYFVAVTTKGASAFWEGKNV